MFQSYSDCIVEADDFYSQNSVSDIIAAHLKMMSFEKYYPEHEDPRRRNIWIVNPFVEHKETAISHEETLQLIELSSDKGLESTFNSMSNSKFWIRIKNDYPNLHEIAIRFLLCLSTNYLCKTAFSAMTVLKRNRGTACNFLNVSVWLSLQFTPELISKRRENSNKNVTSLTKTFKNSGVIKETQFNFSRTYSCCVKVLRF